MDCGSLMSTEIVLLSLLLFLALYILGMLGRIANRISDFNGVLISLDATLKKLLAENRWGVEQMNQDHESIVKTGQALSAIGRFIVNFEKSIFRYLHLNVRNPDPPTE